MKLTNAIAATPPGPALPETRVPKAIAAMPTPEAPPPSHSSPWLRRCVLGGACFVCLLCLAAIFISRYAQPMARRHIVRTLEARLGAPVELDRVHVSLRPGLYVEGTGLHVASTGSRPELRVRSFGFATDLSSFFRKQITVVNVQVQGLSVVLPPAPDNGSPAPPPAGHTHGDHGNLELAHIVALDSELIFQNEKDAQNANRSQYPLTFHLSRLVLDDPGKGQPFHFDAILNNGKPINAVHLHGLAGPFTGETAQQPRETPISGRFDFAQADLAGIHGVRGHLHGQGTVAGTVGLLKIDGEGAVPDFALAPGVLTVALDTQFHATLNALTGAIALTNVNARILHTQVTVTGAIVRLLAGHDIALTTELNGRAEDLLNLLSPTRQPPLFTAAILDRGTFHIPPGSQQMLLKMEGQGDATLTNIRWSDQDLQRTVDQLSMRAEDKARLVHDRPDSVPVAPSTVHNHYQLHGGDLQLTRLIYRLPGATVMMQGDYRLPAENLDFHGLVRTDVPASHLTTGIRSLLLKPLDPLLRKSGASMQLPIAFTGAKTSPRLGLDIHNLKADDRLAQTTHP